MSYNLVDPTTGNLTRVAGNSNIVDTAIEIDSTWSSKKINDSLVGIESALDDKVDKAELNAIPLLYNQNTDILAYALTCPKAKRTLVRIHSTNATNNPFGVSTDTDFIYEISKIDSANVWISIKAKDVRTSREFLNTKNDVKWLGWQRVCTTSVADVPYTKLTLNSSVFTLYDSYSYMSYIVRNGMCTITCKGVGLVSVGTYDVVSNIPKPVGGYATSILRVKSETMVPTNPVFLAVYNNELTLFSKSSTGAFWGTLTYPVEES